MVKLVIGHSLSKDLIFSKFKEEEKKNVEAFTALKLKIVRNR